MLGNQDDLPSKAKWGDFLSSVREKSFGHDPNEEVDSDDQPFVKQPRERLVKR